jgi:hypothetical protein
MIFELYRAELYELVLAWFRCHMFAELQKKLQLTTIWKDKVTYMTLKKVDAMPSTNLQSNHMRKQNLKNVTPLLSNKWLIKWHG